jgi:C4-dicarboxylate transporter DctQ subunit
MLPRLKKAVVFSLQVHDFLSKGCFYIGALLLFLMAITTSYDVAMRYFFVRPTSWALDFNEYILCYSTFFAAAWILKLDAHVKVSIILERFGAKGQRILNAVNSVIGALACVVLTWRTAIDTWDTYVEHVLIIRPVIVPKWAVLWVIPFGFLLLGLYFVRNAFFFLSSRKLR